MPFILLYMVSLSLYLYTSIFSFSHSPSFHSASSSCPLHILYLSRTRCSKSRHIRYRLSLSLYLFDKVMRPSVDLCSYTCSYADTNDSQHTGRRYQSVSRHPQTTTPFLLVLFCFSIYLCTFFYTKKSIFFKNERMKAAKS